MMNVIYYLEQEKYKSREEFEHEVKEQMRSINCPFDIDCTFNYLMAYQCAVVLPVSKDNPNGMLMVTNIYRTEVQFMR